MGFTIINNFMSGFVYKNYKMNSYCIFNVAFVDPVCETTLFKCCEIFTRNV